MKDIRIILPNPASDTAGAASMLFQLGGLSIIHDAAGSMESYITFDESRELTGKRTVASRLSRLEAITGNDSTLLNKIETECTNNPPPFTAILGSPVPFTIGTDLDGIAAEAEFITGVPSFAVNSGGFAIYDKGAGEAFPKVDGEGGCHTVDVARDGAHGGGKDGRDKGSGNTGRHLTHHEEGEDGIGLPHGDIKFGRMGLIEGVEACTNHVEGNRDKYAHDTIDEDTATCRLLVGCSEVALDDGLVRGVGDEVVGQAANDDDPPCGL